MTKTLGRAWGSRVLAMRVLPLLLLALSAPLATACSAQGAQESAATTASDEQAAPQAQDGEAAAGDDQVAGAGRTEGDAALGAWADECLDRRGDVTVYAISELKGGQLNALLQEQDYSWNERNQMWVKEDGSAAVVALDEKGEHLTADEMAALAQGSAEQKVSYRIVTSGYNSVKKVFDGLAGKVMTCEDVCYVEDGAVGIVSAASARRSLVLVAKSNNVYTVTIMGEDAVAQGLLDNAAGKNVGTSIDEAFATLAGRAPGSEE